MCVTMRGYMQKDLEMKQGTTVQLKEYVAQIYTRQKEAWDGLEKPQPEPEGLINHITKFPSYPRDDEKRKLLKYLIRKESLFLNDMQKQRQS